MTLPVRLAIVVLVSAVASAASAAPGTLTVLTTSDGELQAARVDAIRAEAAVRGLAVEVLHSAGSDALAAALVQRAGVAAVIWTDGPTLWVRAPDGRVAHAPLGGGDVTPRVVAAIASSLLDDLGLAPAPAVRVDVDVHIGPPVAPTLPAVAPHGGELVAPGMQVVAAEQPRPSAWFLDVGGLAAPGGIYEAHLGLGRYVTDAARAAAIAHAVRVPGGVVGAGTFNLSQTWGSRVRAEAGGRALLAVRFYDNVDCDSGECMSVLSTEAAFGVGAFFGVGLRARWGTLYARAGVDVVRSLVDEATATPSGAIGLELPL